MSDYSWLSILQQERAIGVIRSPQLSLGKQLAISIAAGGMQLIEITWNGDRPAELIAQLRAELPACLIGAGTLLTPEHLHDAMAAGAQFVFTPHTNPAIIKIALAAGIPIIPGALSPTEIVTAWQAGATCVKVFPVSVAGGASYIKSLQGPLGRIPLIPTGGVTLDNAGEFIAAGAIGVGLSSSLFPKDLLEARNWQAIAQIARTLMQNLNKI